MQKFIKIVCRPFVGLRQILCNLWKREILGAEVGLLILLVGVCVWHWLWFLFYEQNEGKRRKDERRREKRKYRGLPWGDPEV